MTNRLLTFAKIAFGLTLICIISWRFDPHSILNAIGSYSILPVLIAVLLFLLASLIATSRWRLYVPGFRYKVLLRLFFIGQFYGMLLPGQLAGEAVKAYRIAKGQAEKTSLITSVIVDRVVSTLAMLFLGAFGLGLTPLDISPALSISLFSLTALLCAMLIGLRIPVVFAFFVGASEQFRRIGPRSAKAASAIDRFLSVWRDYSKAPFTLLLSFVLALVFHFMAVALYAILAFDLGIHVTLVDWLWINAVVSLALVLPVTIAGIGVREGVLIGSLGILGVPGEQAIALSIGLFALMVLGALIGWWAEITYPDPVASSQ